FLPGSCGSNDLQKRPGRAHPKTPDVGPDIGERGDADISERAGEVNVALPGPGAKRPECLPSNSLTQRRQSARTRRIAGSDCLGNGRISIFACFSLAPGFSRVTLGNMGNSAVSTAFRQRDNPLKRVWHSGYRPHPAEAGC